MALPLYGAGSYPYTASDDPAGYARTGHVVGGPIGGGAGYRHYYNPANYAGHLYTVTTYSQLQSALSNSSSGDLIWVTASFTGKVKAGTLKSGVVLAGNRGQSGAAGPTINCTASTFMSCSANCVVSGLSIIGPSATSGTYGFSCGTASGQEFENLYIRNFSTSAINWSSNSADFSGVWNASTPYIHHCDIAGSQMFGLGYGVSAYSAGGFILEASIVADNRHHTMANPQKHGANYEVRWCEVGDAWNSQGSNTQLDVHGCGCSGICKTGPVNGVPGYHACGYIRIHHCTLTNNRGRASIGVRGLITHSFEADHNWTKFTSHTGLWPVAGSASSRTVAVPSGGNAVCEVAGTNLVYLCGEEGGSWGCANDGPLYGLYSHDNWWGTSAPPGAAANPGPVVSFSASPASGNIPLAVKFTDGSLNGPTSWYWEFGDGGTSTSQNPSHTYQTAGTYDVTLTAQNANGSNSLTMPGYISVLSASQMTALYGAGAYTGSNPIGGGNGYVSLHGYSQATANYVVTTLDQLQSALSAATSGKVIWIPNGVIITWASTSSIGTLKEGAVLASNRGQGGAVGGKLKWTVANPGSFMYPLLTVSSRCVVSGLVFEGASPYRTTSNSGPSAIRGYNIKRLEVENCDISDFSQGGIWFDPAGIISPWDSDDPATGRHWIHHCYIHGIQQHGEGYGVGQQGEGGSMLIEACHFGPCRHEIMNQQTYSYNPNNSIEVRYCIFEDAVYAMSGNPSNMNQQHQVDAHGSGTSSGYYSADHYVIHHNTFSANTTYATKANVGIRGRAKTEIRVYNNWTKKTHGGQSGLFSETVVNPAFTALNSGGGALSSGYALSGYNMLVYDNWYGVTAPPGGALSPQVATAAASSVTRDTATLNGTIVSLGGAASAMVSFDWGPTTSYGNATASQLKTISGNFSAALSGLATGTIYHFRAKMSAGGSTYYGSDQQFTSQAAQPTAPVVRTDPADNIQRRSAELNMALLDMGSATSVLLSFQYGQTPAYGQTTPAASVSSPFFVSRIVPDLTPSTTYHFRAVAVGDGLTSYGADQEFTTQSAISVPTCTTLPATRITAESAVLNARAEGLSETARLVRWGFRWGLTADALTEDWHAEADITQDTLLSHQIDGLAEDTEYFYQAYIVLG